MDYEFHWNVVFQNMPQLLNGAFVTLHVSVLAMLLGVVIAILLAIAKMSFCLAIRLPTKQLSIAKMTFWRSQK